MSDKELQEQFKRCQEWQDPEQWDILGVLYFERRYYLNADVCFKRAAAIRDTVPVCEAVPA